MLFLATTCTHKGRSPESLFYSKRKVVELKELDKETAAKIFLHNTGEDFKIKSVKQLVENEDFRELLKLVPLVPSKIIELAILRGTGTLKELLTEIQGKVSSKKALIEQ